MSVCCQDESAKGCRDAALTAVLHGAGLRRAEVVALELADWNPEEGCLTVRSGMGDQDRTTYLDEGAMGCTDGLAGTAGGSSQSAVLSHG